MGEAAVLQGVRQTRFEALPDRRERGELNQEEAAEMLGISERTFCGWRDRRRDEGRSGFDRPADRQAIEPAGGEGRDLAHACRQRGWCGRRQSARRIAASGPDERCPG